MSESNYNIAGFGDKLKKARESKNYSQKDLADILGVSQSVCSYYECSSRVPCLNTVIQLATALNTSIDGLLGRYDWKD